MEPIKIPYNIKAKALGIIVFMMIVLSSFISPFCDFINQLCSEEMPLLVKITIILPILGIILIAALIFSIPVLLIMSFTPLTITEDGIKFYSILISYKNITNITYNPKNNILTIHCNEPFLKNNKKNTAFPLFLSFFKITPKDLLQLLPSTIPVEEDKR